MQEMSEAAVNPAADLGAYQDMQDSMEAMAVLNGHQALKWIESFDGVPNVLRCYKCWRQESISVMHHPKSTRGHLTRWECSGSTDLARLDEGAPL